MSYARLRRLLVISGLLLVLGSVGSFAAARPSAPLPPCKPFAVTGAVREPALCRPSTQTPSTQTGKRGLTGRRGPAGAKGARGAKGAKGARGVKGDVGAAGPTGPAGPAGESGAQGPTGLQGVKGDVGAAGPTGPAGPAGGSGAQGPTGLQGDTGATGAAGPTGPTGPAGPAGPVGPTGSAGSVGPAGPAGATGPAGGLAEYAYVYNEIAQVVPIEADVTFDSNGILTPGITHAPGIAGVALTTAGIYKVSFSVSGVEPAQFALFRNGAAVGGSVYGSGAGTQQSTGQVIVTLNAADVLTVRNHTSAAAVTLQTLAGGTQTNVNASMLIEKLG